MTSYNSTTLQVGRIEGYIEVHEGLLSHSVPLHGAETQIFQYQFLLGGWRPTSGHTRQ